MSKCVNIIKKISFSNIKKGFRYLKHYGFKEFVVRLNDRLEPDDIPYDEWYEYYKPDKTTLNKQKNEQFDFMPLVSIVVPTYETPSQYLIEMIDSLVNQTYSNWQLCVANASPDNMDIQEILEKYSKKDSRIIFKNLNENLGISENTNVALGLVTGDYIGLLDHDDILAPEALYYVVKTINELKDVDVLYTDEDKVSMDLSENFEPNLKPDFNIDLLRSNNYICHFFVAKKSLLDSVGGFRKEFDGAQDYDFIFRCVEKAKNVVHISEILYHWRSHTDSTAANPASKMYAFDAGKRAIESHLKRVGICGEVINTSDLGFYRVKYAVVGSPLVSIIIPNKDEKETLKTCIDSILSVSTYKNYEIIIVENNSTSSEIFEYYDEVTKNSNIHVVKWKDTFNYSAINNFGAEYAHGEYLLFLNNDVKVITPDWIEEMLGICQRSEVGICGVKLIYPDNTIQHAGCVVGMGGIAGHMFVNLPVEKSSYMHKASIIQDMSAVTAACMMVKKNVFEKVNGFTTDLAVAFNDVDFCLKIREEGYLVVYNPYAQLYHYESKTRGYEDNKEKIKRFQSEIEYMRCHWIDILKDGDPYYNKNLSLKKWNYSLRLLPGMKIKE